MVHWALCIFPRMVVLEKNVRSSGGLSFLFSTLHSSMARFSSHVSCCHVLYEFGVSYHFRALAYSSAHASSSCGSEFNSLYYCQVRVVCLASVQVPNLEVKYNRIMAHLKRDLFLGRFKWAPF
ncbi:hypothetical protein M758_6G189600 [Ceratodon purpureus]|uniref:Uncharacterized protein n=1 Tax=Ceratodon purpureus TaxID=3225 RepID=A0A8T0HJG2_CERPU|nr:hypothetical protein KC19_6G197800 [Ceratodon purpureus]KAG0614602.1 hypothetical protein M758_6G189600 [Ceratodon purpureus]